MRAGHRLATPEIAMQETAEEEDLHSLLLEATPEQETPGLHLEATLEVEIRKIRKCKYENGKKCKYKEKEAIATGREMTNGRFRRA